MRRRPLQLLLGDKQQFSVCESLTELMTVKHRIRRFRHLQMEQTETVPGILVIAI